MHYETKNILFLLLENCLKTMILFGTDVRVSVETKLCLSILEKLQGLSCVSTFQFYMCCSSGGFLFCVCFSQLKSSYQLQKDNTHFFLL